MEGLNRGASLNIYIFFIAVLLLLQWPHHSKIFFFERKKWLSCAPIYLIQSYIQAQRQKEIKGFSFFFFQLWSDWATRRRPARAECIYYRQACWRRVLYLAKLISPRWPFCIGAAALRLMNVSWKGWLVLGPARARFAVWQKTRLLWGRVEVKNSGHDKQRTPGTTSDMQPPTPNPSAHRRQASMSEQRGVQLCAQSPTFGFVSHADVLSSCFIFSGCGC